MLARIKKKYHRFASTGEVYCASKSVQRRDIYTVYGETRSDWTTGPTAGLTQREKKGTVNTVNTGYVSCIHGRMSKSKVEA